MTKVLELDARPGGNWRFVSSAADRDDVEFFASGMVKGALETSDRLAAELARG